MTNIKQPYVRFYPSDWLAGTRGMTAHETGIYITLIALMYEKCEPLYSDYKRLSRICGCGHSVFKKAIKILIDDGKIIVINDSLWNNRVEKEFSFRQEKSKKAKNSAQKRWDNSEKSEEKQQSDNANAPVKHCSGDAIPYSKCQKPYKEEKTKKEESPNRQGDGIDFSKSGEHEKTAPSVDDGPATKKAKPSCSEYSDEFETFWQTYPRKKGKGSKTLTYRKWQSMSKSTQSEVMIGVAEYARQCEENKTEDQFVKLPATYINVKNRFWEEHVDEANGVNVEEAKELKRIHAEIRKWSDDKWRNLIRGLQERQRSWPACYGPTPGSAGAICPIIPSRPVHEGDVINGQFVR